jgi:hypothetical protein
VTRPAVLTLTVLALLAAPALALAPAEPGLKVSWMPAHPLVGDIAILLLQGAGEGAIVEGLVGGRPITFFSGAGVYAALVGFDLGLVAGRKPWRVDVREPGREPRGSRGTLHVRHRNFPVQRLTLPAPMVDLDPATERRAVAEGEVLRTLYRTISPERLWRGPFVRPVSGNDPGSGFGSRRIINGQPRTPHGGTDYAAARGTPVVAVNDGRVALVAEHFFPGRLVVIDHGLGLHTLYFHLDEARVEIGERVVRGQPLGTVGSTGRATGPHLHFGVQVGAARVDPDRFLALGRLDS